MNSLISFLLLGLLVGLLARLLSKQPTTLVGSATLGGVGAFVGGMLGALTGTNDPFAAVRLEGLIWAGLGAILVLMIAALARASEARKRAQLFPRAYPTRRLAPLSDDLLESDRRSFATISKRYEARE